jgi:hypothetical protein
VSIVTTTLATVTDAALGIWLGTILFFSFVGAPRLFRALDEAAAGRAVNAIFPRYYTLGIGLGAVAAAATVAGTAVRSPAAATGALLGAVGIAASANAYARWVLIPRMDAAGDDGFARYHRQSVVLNAVTMFAVGAAFVARHAGG